MLLIKKNQIYLPLEKARLDSVAGQGITTKVVAFAKGL